MSQQKTSALISLLCSKILPGSPVSLELISSSLMVLGLLSSLQPGKALPSPPGLCLSSSYQFIIFSVSFFLILLFFFFF